MFGTFTDRSFFESETNEMFVDKEHEKKEKDARRILADSQFVQARCLADRHGMQLQRHTDVHYTLWGPRRQWQKHIYPGNQRLYAPSRNGPFLLLPMLWTLLDVVNAAVEKIQDEATP